MAPACNTHDPMKTIQKAYNAYSTDEERKAMEKFVIDREKMFMYGSSYSKTWLVCIENDILFSSFTLERAAALHALNHLYIPDTERLALKDMIESPDDENLVVALAILEQYNITII